jgi:hypothetical protein
MNFPWTFLVFGLKSGGKYCSVTWDATLLAIAGIENINICSLQVTEIWTCDRSFHSTIKGFVFAVRSFGLLYASLYRRT